MIRYRPIGTIDSPYSKDPDDCSRIAFATTDGHTYTTDHFGSADIYVVYTYDSTTFLHVEDIENSTEEEEVDGDVRKARSILELLVGRGVDVVVARRFGPNIRKISRLLVPVVTGTRDISSTLPALASAWNDVLACHEHSADKRRHVVLETANKVAAGIKEGVCQGCGRCIPACPVDALTMEDTCAVIDPIMCVGCGACVSACPFDAIEGPAP